MPERREDNVKRIDDLDIIFRRYKIADSEESQKTERLYEQVDRLEFLYILRAFEYRLFNKERVIYLILPFDLQIVKLYETDERERDDRQNI